MPRTTIKGRGIPAPKPADRMTSDQVTAEFPIARRTLYGWAQDGRIHVWKLGSRNIYDRAELEALIQPQRRSA